MRFILCIVALLGQMAFAGTRVNNGGGAWMCNENGSGANRFLRSADLVEYYDWYITGGMTPINPKLSYEEVYLERVAFIDKTIPKLSALLKKYPIDFKTAIQFKAGPLPLARDAGDPLKPYNCADATLLYRQLALYLIDDNLLIDQDLWNNPALSPVDKGALLLHEAIYKALRAEFGDENSTRARRIVGIMFIDLNIGTHNKEILSILSEPAPKGESEYIPANPVKTACRAATYGDGTDYKEITMPMLNRFTTADAAVTLDRFTFSTGIELRAGAWPRDGVAEKMEIADATTGAVASLDPQELRLALLNVGYAKVNLSLGPSANAQMECFLSDGD